MPQKYSNLGLDRRCPSAHTNAAAAPRRPSRAGAGDASHSVSPKTAKSGGLLTTTSDVGDTTRGPGEKTDPFLSGWVSPEGGGRNALEGGGAPPPPPSRAPSLCPATVPLTASASFNGIRNRQ